jgi:hypothetical protein
MGAENGSESKSSKDEREGMRRMMSEDAHILETMASGAIDTAISNSQEEGEFSKKQAKRDIDLAVLKKEFADMQEYQAAVTLSDDMGMKEGGPQAFSVDHTAKGSDSSSRESFKVEADIVAKNKIESSTVDVVSGLSDLLASKKDSGQSKETDLKDHDNPNNPSDKEENSPSKKDSGQSKETDLKDQILQEMREKPDNKVMENLNDKIMRPDEKTQFKQNFEATKIDSINMREEANGNFLDMEDIEERKRRLDAVENKVPENYKTYREFKGDEGTYHQVHTEGPGGTTWIENQDRNIDRKIYYEDDPVRSDLRRVGKEDKKDDLGLKKDENKKIEGKRTHENELKDSGRQLKYYTNEEYEKYARLDPVKTGLESLGGFYQEIKKEIFSNINQIADQITNSLIDQVKSGDINSSTIHDKIVSKLEGIANNIIDAADQWRYFSQNPSERLGEALNVGVEKPKDFGKIIGESSIKTIEKAAPVIKALETLTKDKDEDIKPGVSEASKTSSTEASPESSPISEEESGEGTASSNTRQTPWGMVDIQSGKFTVGERGGVDPEDEFVNQAKAHGFEVLGRHVTVETPVGPRHVDVVLRSPSGSIGGVELKSTEQEFDRSRTSQETKDSWINRVGGTITGKNADALKEAGIYRIDNIVKVCWERPEQDNKPAPKK